MGLLTSFSDDHSDFLEHSIGRDTPTSVEFGESFSNHTI
jgi:hypothetical protein